MGYGEINFDLRNREGIWFSVERYYPKDHWDPLYDGCPPASLAFNCVDRNFLEKVKDWRENNLKGKNWVNYSGGITFACYGMWFFMLEEDITLFKMKWQDYRENWQPF